MKKIVSLTLTAILALTTAFAFSGCNNQSEKSPLPFPTISPTKRGRCFCWRTWVTSNTGEASTNETSTSTSSYRTLDEIKESGKIVIGVFSDKAPFGYIDENGDYQGYDVYFAERLAEDLGVEVEDALGNADTIAPAVQKGNTTLLDWVNSEIEALGEENFFHADYEATLASVYGEAADPDSLVVEGGKIE